MSSKHYPGEFKIEAVKQVVDRGHSGSVVGYMRTFVALNILSAH